MTTTTQEETPVSERPLVPHVSDSLRLVFVALLLGFAVNLLFFDRIPGMNFIIFVVLAILGLMGLAWAERTRPALGAVWLAAPMLALAGAVVFRTEPLTVLVSVWVTLALGLLWAGSFAVNYLHRRGVIGYVLGMAQTSVESLARVGSELGHGVKQMAGNERGGGQALPILRGLLLALPVVVVFTALLSAADLVFAQNVTDTLELLNLDNLPILIQRLMLIGFSTLVFTGLGSVALLPGRINIAPGDGDKLIPPFLGATEAGIVLGSINALFLAFVVVQFRYLFGGAAVNINDTAYTYSEYARRGFGELVAVVTLTLLILLALAHVTRREQPRTHWLFLGLTVFMVALVLIINISALQRLLIYEAVFGFTRLRTYSHVAIIWLGVLFLPFVLAVVAKRLHWFALGGLLCVIGFSVTLPVLNIDRYIAETNIYYAERAGDLDIDYLMTLSPDAIPALIPLLDHPDAVVADTAGAGLACWRYYLENDEDFQTWQGGNLSRQAARTALAAIGPQLEASWPVQLAEDDLVTEIDRTGFSSRYAGPYVPGPEDAPRYCADLLRSRSLLGLD